MVTGKCVVVTGAAGALGRAVVDSLGADGANVVASVHATAELALWPESSAPLPVVTDLLDEADVQRMIDGALARFGRIDALLCLAGGFFGDTAVIDTPLARLREQFELNLVTTYTCVHAVLPHMLDAGGAIVGVSSRPAVRPATGVAAYGVAKLGVIKLMESVADEYRQHGIRANAILPSIIDTPANRQAMPSADFTRWVRPEQIAAVLRFLVSDEASIISGAAIPVYGRA